MSLSFQEKSLWVMLVSLVAAFGCYFITVLPAQALNVMPHQVALFGMAVATLVAVQVVGHIVISAIDRRMETDERDRLIELKGTRNASWVLGTGVFLALCAALMTPGNFVFTHVLLGFWALSQLVEIGSQLVLHRRGA